MKALVFSDSHGYIKNMIKAIDHFKDEIDIIIHLGDYVDDVSELLYLYDIPIYNVVTLKICHTHQSKDKSHPCKFNK